MLPSLLIPYFDTVHLLPLPSLKSAQNVTILGDFYSVINIEKQREQCDELRELRVTSYPSFRPESNTLFPKLSLYASAE